MKFKLSILGVFFTIFSFAQNATISGTVTDKDLKDEALPFANVTIKGTSTGATTDMDGKYAIDVPAGNHIVVFSFLGYVSKEIPFIVIEGEKKTINQSIGSGSVTMKDVVVKATQKGRERESALLLDQKNAIEIKQSIGAQEMARKGVSTVEQGVSKISGVSKVADRGIFIRGLDDRYNYLQINGLNFIPSDPNLKTIPLSYIPTDIVRNVDVYKTFNSSLYQDFAGASINILTKDVSSKPYTKVSISVGGNTITSLQDHKISNDGTSEFFGYTGNNRNLPTEFGKNQILQYDATSLESKKLFNSSWTPKITKAPLTLGTSFTNSDSYSLSNERKIGYLFNMNFSNNYITQTGQRRNLNSSGTAFKDFETSKWSYFTQKSALATINYRKQDKYNYFLNLIYIQNSENTIEESKGENTDFITIDKPFFLRDTKYSENTSVGIQQLGNIIFLDRKFILDYAH